MGFLSTVTIYNDALHKFKEDPAEFGKAVLGGVDEAHRINRETSAPFGSNCNYISCQPSRHADDHTLYLHYGNMVFNLNAYGEDFKELAKNQPELVKKMLKVAKDLLKESSAELKKQTTEKET